MADNEDQPEEGKPDNKPKRGFFPGSVVRVRGQLMGVGTASLRGLLDEADSIDDLPRKEILVAQQGVVSSDLTPDILTGELTPSQERAAEVAEDKADRARRLRAGLDVDDVDAEQAEEESRLGDTSKPAEEAGTISAGTPPPGTEADETGRLDATGSKSKSDREDAESVRQTGLSVKDAEAVEKGAPLGATRAQKQDFARAADKAEKEAKTDAEVEAEYVEPKAKATKKPKA